MNLSRNIFMDLWTVHMKNLTLYISPLDLLTSNLTDAGDSGVLQEAAGKQRKVGWGWGGPSCGLILIMI